MSENKDYLEDLKNLKPLPPEIIPGKGKCRIRKEAVEQLTPINLKDEIRESSKIIYSLNQEEKKMDSLKGSKTLWGFGIAVFIYIVQHILIALNIAGPDNLIVKSVIEVVIAVSGFFGVYGVRDALRKMGG